MTCVYEENIHTLDIQFPKVTQNNVCKVIAFGDWCKSDNGGNTLKRLAEYAKDTDAVVFLGDMAYDLDTKDGEVGNDFLKFAQGVTSAIPFQVKIILLNYISFHTIFSYQLEIMKFLDTSSILKSVL